MTRQQLWWVPSTYSNIDQLLLSLVLVTETRIRHFLSWIIDSRRKRHFHSPVRSTWIRKSSVTELNALERAFLVITRQQSVKISFYTTASLRRENVQMKYPSRGILVDRQKSISIDGWVLNDHGIVDLSRYHDMCEPRSRLFWVITDTIITIIYASADIVTVRNVLLYSNLIYYPART